MAHGYKGALGKRENDSCNSPSLSTGQEGGREKYWGGVYRNGAGDGCWRGRIIIRKKEGEVQG